MTRSQILILAGIVGIALFLRVWALPSTPVGLYPDEAMNGNNALEAIETGEWKVFYPENNGREGLFINIQALFLQAIGEREPWVLRLPSAIFGTLTVLGLFFLLRSLAAASGFSSPYFIASAGSLFLALSHWHLIFSRIGFRAIMAPFFLTWAVYFFILAVENRKFRHAALAGVSFGLGMYSYIAFRVTPAVLLAFVPFYRNRPIFWRALGGSAIAAVIVAVPLGAYFYLHPADIIGRTSQLSIFASETPLLDLLKNTAKTAGMFFWRGDGNWRHNFSGHPQLFFPVAVLFLIGIITAFRRRSMFDTVFLWWMALAALPVVISNEGMPHALRSIIMIPVVFGLAGSGAEQAWNFISRRLPIPAVQGIAGLIVLSAALYASLWYFYFWASHSQTALAFAKDYVLIGREINALPAGTEVYVIVEAPGGDVRGIPMPAQTVMFMTDSFRLEDRETKRIHYVTPAEFDAAKPAAGARVFVLK